MSKNPKQPTDEEKADFEKRAKAFNERLDMLLKEFQVTLNARPIINAVIDVRDNKLGQESGLVKD